MTETNLWMRRKKCEDLRIKYENKSNELEQKERRVKEYDQWFTKAVAAEFKQLRKETFLLAVLQERSMYPDRPDLRNLEQEYLNHAATPGNHFFSPLKPALYQAAESILSHAPQDGKKKTRKEESGFGTQKKGRLGMPPRECMKDCAQANGVEETKEPLDIMGDLDPAIYESCKKKMEPEMQVLQILKKLDSTLSKQNQGNLKIMCIMEIGEYIHYCLEKYKDPEKIKTWESHLWCFVCNFTQVDAWNMYKDFDRAAMEKEGAEKPNRSEQKVSVTELEKKNGPVDQSSTASRAHSSPVMKMVSERPKRSVADELLFSNAATDSPLFLGRRKPRKLKSYSAEMSGEEADPQGDPVAMKVDPETTQASKSEAVVNKVEEPEDGIPGPTKMKLRKLPCRCGHRSVV